MSRTLLSLKDAAQILKVDQSTIRRACTKHGIGQKVPNWVLTKADVQKLKKVVRSKPGNPNFTAGNRFGESTEGKPLTQARRVLRRE